MENKCFIERLREESCSCRNMYELCLKLGIESIGGNTYREIRKIAEENSIELKFDGTKKPVTITSKELSLDKLLVDGSRIKSNALKAKLILAGLKEYRCEKCGCSEWQGLPVPLELHHVNGKNSDNRLDNLQILCRNCHGQTDNFCGKNTKARRNLRGNVQNNNKDFFLRIDRNYLSQLLCTMTLRECARELDVNIGRLKYWLKKLGIKVTTEWKKEKVQEYKDRIGVCKNCGAIFIKKRQGQIYCSESCAHANTKVVDVTKEELINTLKEHKSFTSTAKCFGVSDKCIAKWCKRFGMPTKKKELFEYINGCLV